MIAIHAYGTSDLTQSKLQPIVQKAQAAGKKLMMQEWGMCYFDTSNNNCPKGNALSASTRDANIKKYADEISKSGIPWMYWQIIPNADPHDGYDYEVRELLWKGRGIYADSLIYRSASTRRTGALSRLLLRLLASTHRRSTSPSGCLEASKLEYRSGGLCDFFELIWSQPTFDGQQKVKDVASDSTQRLPIINNSYIAKRYSR